MKFKQYIIEDAKVIGRMVLPDTSGEITQQDLRHLERILDSLFKTLKIDIEFTHHFLDRVNDPRNKQQITFAELQSLFTKTYVKFGSELAKMGDGVQGVLDDIQDNINIPFVLQWDDKKKMVDLVSKTIMRKKSFKTSNRIFKI